VALGESEKIVDSSGESVAPSGEAVALLKSMRDYFVRTTDIEFESVFNVTSDLPNLSNRGTAHFFIRQPDRFRIELSSHRGKDVFILDGATLTLYRPAERKFAKLKARDSIIGSMYLVAGLLNLQARFIDFLWTMDYGRDVSISQERIETIGTKQCRHISVHRFEDDWEVWLEQTGTPLPCKLLSRRTDGSALTAHSNVFRWKESPVFSEDIFSFAPAKGSRKVEVSDLD
jgi:hypothetical protein